MAITLRRLENFLSSKIGHVNVGSWPGPAIRSVRNRRSAIRDKTVIRQT
jgi:hypothetical protein